MQVSGQIQDFYMNPILLNFLAPTTECESKDLLTFATFTSDEAAINPVVCPHEPFVGSSGASTFGGDWA
jgi:hypothetical protein